jgi:hypothetical protein
MVDDSIETLEQGSHSTGARTSLIEMPSVARTSAVLLPQSGARTAIVEMPVGPPPMEHTVMSRAPMTPAPLMPQPLPPTARLDGTPPPNPFLAAMLPSPELASVHGGSTVTGASAIDIRDFRASKWTFAVLGVAALLGVIAAIAIQIAPSDDPQPARGDDHKVMQLEVPTPVEQAPVVQPAVEQPVAAPPVAEVTPPPVDTTTPPQPAAETSAAPMQPTEPTAVEQPKQKDSTSRKARSAQAVKKVASSGADATLRVNTYEGTWAWAYVAGQKQYAPGAKFKLPAGRYTVKLTNTNLHITRQCRIEIGSGQVMTLSVELEEGQCDVSKY